MPSDKFAQIAQNEIRALTSLRDLIMRCVHKLLVNKVAYALREVRFVTEQTDKKGKLLDRIPVSLWGKELHDIGNAEVLERSLYADPAMPVDSQIERYTTDESKQRRVTVFAELPRIKIPKPLGNYNSDFGYCLHKNGQAQELSLVVETKGYDNTSEIPDLERWTIDSAKQFFAALKMQGFNVYFKTKINGTSIAQLISEIDPSLVARAS